MASNDFDIGNVRLISSVFPFFYIKSFATESAAGFFIKFGTVFHRRVSIDTVGTSQIEKSEGKFPSYRNDCKIQGFVFSSVCWEPFDKKKLAYKFDVERLMV